MAQTRSALLFPQLPTRSLQPNAVERWVYRGDPVDDYWAGHMLCRRTVVVERGRIESAQAPEQTGIWTFYGKRITAP